MQKRAVNAFQSEALTYANWAGVKRGPRYDLLAVPNLKQPRSELLSYTTSDCLPRLEISVQEFRDPRYDLLVVPNIK